LKSKHFPLNFYKEFHVALGSLLQHTVAQSTDPTLALRLRKPQNFSKNLTKPVLKLSGMEKQPVRINVALDAELVAPLIENFREIMLPVDA
jgi:hypothetical protein